VGQGDPGRQYEGAVSERYSRNPVPRTAGGGCKKNGGRPSAGRSGARKKMKSSFWLATDRHAEISNDRNYLAWWLPLGTS